MSSENSKPEVQSMTIIPWEIVELKCFHGLAVSVVTNARPDRRSFAVRHRT